MDSRFDLDRVLDPDFQMLHGPEVIRVSFLSITVLHLADSEALTLTFLSDIPVNADELRRRIKAHTPLEYLCVHRLEMEFVFPLNQDQEKGSEVKQGHCICCELIAPSTHNLESDSNHHVIWQLLLRWGLYDGPPYGPNLGSAPRE